MIVPFAPARPTDVIARIIAQKLSESWGQQVVVDNRAGAGGNIGMGLAANAAPDGYTILVVSSSFVVNPTLYAKIPYDPYMSFVPVTNAAASPNVFTVHPSVSAKSMQELIALARGNPRKYNIATPGVGTTPDLGAELLKMTTQVDVVRVPYGGAGPAVAAVVGNQVPIGCTALPPTTPHIQAGRLRALAVTSAKRSSAQPDVKERVAGSASTSSRAAPISSLRRSRPKSRSGEGDSRSGTQGRVRAVIESPAFVSETAHGP